MAMRTADMTLRHGCRGRHGREVTPRTASRILGGGLLRAAAYRENLKRAAYSVPSRNRSTSCRQVSTHALLVFQTYTY